MRNRYDKRRDVFPGFSGLEKTARPLWDRQTYPAAGTQRLAFFAAAPTDLSRGNIKLPGTIPAGHGQEIDAIAVMIRAQQSTAAAALVVLNDLFLIIDTGILTIDIANKRQLEIPLCVALGGSGLWSALAHANPAAGSIGVVQGGYPHAMNAYWLSTPLAIPEQQNFVVEARWPTTQAVSANRDITVVLLGSEYRPKL